MTSDPTLSFYTDGAFRFAKGPAYGWVAVTPDGTRVASGHGRMTNDGSNSFAGEIGAAIRAIEYALLRGVRHVCIHTDLSTLYMHFRRSLRPQSRSCVKHLQALLTSHPELVIEVRTVSGKHPLLEAAHHLARIAIDTDHDQTLLA